jgi:hypothetical protein
MLLRLILLSAASLAGGFAVLKASVVMESYVLLTLAMLLQLGGVAVLFGRMPASWDRMRAVSDA